MVGDKEKEKFKKVLQSETVDSVITRASHLKLQTNVAARTRAMNITTPIPGQLTCTNVALLLRGTHPLQKYYQKRILSYSKYQSAPRIKPQWTDVLKAGQAWRRHVSLAGILSAFKLYRDDRSNDLREQN